MKISNDSLILLDTNILVYALNSSSEFYNDCKMLRDKGINGEINVCIAPQVLTEFFAIITNHKRVTNPISHEAACKEIENYLNAENVYKIYPREGMLELMLSSLRKSDVIGYKIFDFQLMATMMINNVNKICTYNKNDFIKFENLEVFSPKDLLANVH